jgi:hypothetical protein
MINIQNPSVNQKPYIYRKQIISTGKYYVGKHNGNNPYYKGSGTEWRNDYKLYVKNRKIDLIEEILEYVDDLKDLNKKEKFWLEYFDAANNSLYYNLTNKNYGPSITTQETKDKIGEANRKPKPEGFGKLHEKPILQYDINGNFIKEWPSTTEIKRTLGLKNITGTCKGKYLTCGEFIFRYKNDPLPKNYKLPIHGNKNNPRSEEMIKRMMVPRITNRKPILQYDLNNNFIKEWPSIKEASLELNINCGGISGCCRGSSPKAGNYKWKYKNKI